jgi:hypothetical protein
LGAAETTAAEPLDVEAAAAVGGGILLNVLDTGAFEIGAGGSTLLTPPPKSLPKSLSPLSKYDKADDDDEGAAVDAAAVAADCDGSVDEDDVAAVTVCDKGCDCD